MFSDVAVDVQSYGGGVKVRMFYPGVGHLFCLPPFVLRDADCVGSSG